MSNLNDEDKVKKEESKIPKKEEKEEKKEPTVEEKLKNTEDKLLRSLAELENQRNRFEKDLKEAIDFGGFNFARENLSILDNLQRAYISIKNDETLKNNKDLDKFLKNIEIIEKDLLSIFKKNKIEKINTLKKKFDPNFHQAMTEIEDNKVEPGTIVQEIQAGYMFGERLLRPSLVSVSKKSDQKIKQNKEKDEKKS
ncbi:MAG: nucleotide exchange factor GrpE [Pelagibacteraceae bacterium]|mgnify:FL=1|jgi:molecular chaperone GrpE|nr:nucleotide exchange factor GrpE [Pelagibacteraceae bacterium]MBO6481613.1 nucleotide exchange factor GrpE [Pelagibacteraceae bacterium]MBO6483322.1 nucleotide exchange factor GrpE [Pelagibacteraceae bacterium]MBO6484889.1 nucleotide exchange factor GrpE [Pelagibacteraceae bacterium]MBO6487713.1 nucleotide exchange factor GrpE [Pelagibacteraceae bacterium]